MKSLQKSCALQHVSNIQLAPKSEELLAMLPGPHQSVPKYHGQTDLAGEIVSLQSLTEMKYYPGQSRVQGS